MKCVAGGLICPLDDSLLRMSLLSKTLAALPQTSGRVLKISMEAEKGMRNGKYL